MRKALAFLFCILLVFCNTLNFIKIGWFYSNQNYVVENLCKNKNNYNTRCAGRCYLSNILKEKNNKESKISLLHDYEINFYNQETIVINFSNFFNDLIIYKLYKFYTPIWCHFKILKPPEF